MNTRTDGFDPGDDEQVIRILKKWKGGVLSDALFTVLAGILPQPTIETVIIRERNNTLEVLLIPRPSHDSIWPGILHSPGQALRRMDYFREDTTPVNGPFERVQKNEIKTSFTFSPKFVGVAQYMTKRGPEAVHVYLTAVAEDAVLPKEAIWVAVDDLSQLGNFMSHQITPIKMAAEYYKKINKKNNRIINILVFSLFLTKLLL